MKTLFETVTGKKKNTIEEVISFEEKRNNFKLTSLPVNEVASTDPYVLYTIEEVEALETSGLLLKVKNGKKIIHYFTIQK